MKASMKWVWVILAIAIIATVAVLLFHKDNGKTNSTSTVSSTSPTRVIITKNAASVGQYLADPSGKTLYTYNADSSGTSKCTAACLATWPAYQDATDAALPANVTVIKRADNSEMQYAYKGKLLYYFRGDATADEVTGNGVGGFSVARP